MKLYAVVIGKKPNDRPSFLFDRIGGMVVFTTRDLARWWIKNWGPEGDTHIVKFVEAKR